MPRNRAGWLFLIGVLGGVTVWFLLRPQALESKERIAPRASSTPDAASIADRAEEQGISSPASRARLEREALRERISGALGAAAREAGAAARTASSVRSRPAWVPGNLRDRTGARQAVVEYLNDDFMPLAKECIEQARERAPSISGMLWMDVEVAAAEDVGGVIDKVEPAANNEFYDEDLIECVRQSALSVILPKSLTTGRERFVLSLRVGSADAAP